MKLSPTPSISFAHREVVAPVGLWERGAKASGYIPPLARLLTPDPGALFAGKTPAPEKHRAPKALATSPSGETGLSTYSILAGERR